jgi:hypothetical protein
MFDSQMLASIAEKNPSGITTDAALPACAAVFCVFRFNLTQASLLLLLTHQFLILILLRSTVTDLKILHISFKVAIIVVVIQWMA